MNYSVLLVQRGIVDTTHAVSGKSGKLYGTAVQTPGYGGVVFKMPMDAYSASADDLIGSTVPMQQWVPHFIAEGSQQNGNSSRTFAGEDRGICGIPAGCRLGPGGSAAEADYVWQHYRFCAGHAPANAKPLWEGAPPVFDGSKLAPMDHSDVRPRIVDRGVGAHIIERDGITPPEILSAPVVGGLHENQTEPVFGTVERPVPLPAYGGPRRAEFQDPALGLPPPPAVTTMAPPAVTTMTPPPTIAAPTPKGPSAAEVIAAAVASAMKEAIPVLMQQIDSKIAATVPQAIPKKKEKAVKLPWPPTLFEVARKRAAELGMNTFGKGKAELDAYIAEHTDSPAAASAAEPSVEGMFA